MLERLWRKGSPPTALVEMYVGADTTGNSMEVPLETKNRAAAWGSNPTSGRIPGQSYSSKRSMHLHNSQDVEATYMSINRWLNNVCVCVCVCIPLSHKKNEIMPLEATCNYRLSHRVKQVRRRKTNTIRYHLHVESKIRHACNCLWNTNRLTDVEDRPVVAEGWRGGGESGVSRCKALQNRQKTSPYCSARERIQSPGINHNGKEYKKAYIYI